MKRIRGPVAVETRDGVALISAPVDRKRQTINIEVREIDFVIEALLIAKQELKTLEGSYDKAAS